MSELISEEEAYEFDTLGEVAKEANKRHEEAMKQAVIDAYNAGQQIPPFDYAEKYYNENYGSDDKKATKTA